jgi:hypothetical protein
MGEFVLGTWWNKFLCGPQELNQKTTAPSGSLVSVVCNQRKRRITILRLDAGVALMPRAA